MKPMDIALIALALLLMVSVMFYHPPDQHVYGHIHIPERDIHAEVYAIGHARDCGCTSTLWNGGKVTVNADLSDVQVGDMADLRGLGGEHLVLECIAICNAWPWLMDPHGDVLVIDSGRVYRFTRL